jgi:adenylate cyclase class IV
MAFEDPYMPAEARREIAEDLGLMEGANIKLKRSFKRAGVVFTLNYIEGMGMFLTAAPATETK